MHASIHILLALVIASSHASSSLRTLPTDDTVVTPISGKHPSTLHPPKAPAHPKAPSYPPRHRPYSPPQKPRRPLPPAPSRCHSYGHCDEDDSDTHHDGDTDDTTEYSTSDDSSSSSDSSSTCSSSESDSESDWDSDYDCKEDDDAPMYGARPKGNKDAFDPAPRIPFAPKKPASPLSVLSPSSPKGSETSSVPTLLTTDTPSTEGNPSLPSTPSKDDVVQDVPPQPSPPSTTPTSSLGDTKDEGPTPLALTTDPPAPWDTASSSSSSGGSDLKDQQVTMTPPRQVAPLEGSFGSTKKENVVSDGVKDVNPSAVDAPSQVSPLSPTTKKNDKPMEGTTDMTAPPTFGATTEATSPLQPASATDDTLNPTKGPMEKKHGGKRCVKKPTGTTPSTTSPHPEEGKEMGNTSGNVLQQCLALLRVAPKQIQDLVNGVNSTLNGTNAANNTNMTNATDSLNGTNATNGANTTNGSDALNNATLNATQHAPNTTMNLTDILGSPSSANLTLSQPMNTTLVWDEMEWTRLGCLEALKVFPNTDSGIVQPAPPVPSQDATALPDASLPAVNPSTPSLDASFLPSDASTPLDTSMDSTAPLEDPTAPQ